MPLHETDKRNLLEKARGIRKDIVEITAWAGGAHIGGGQKSAKVNLFHFARIIRGAGIDHIGLCRMITVTAAGIIEQLRGPLAQQEDQKGAAEAANDLGKCHRVEHRPVSI